MFFGAAELLTFPLRISAARFRRHGSLTPQRSNGGVRSRARPRNNAKSPHRSDCPPLSHPKSNANPNLNPHQGGGGGGGSGLGGGNFHDEDGEFPRGPPKRAEYKASVVSLDALRDPTVSPIVASGGIYLPIRSWMLGSIADVGAWCGRGSALWPDFFQLVLQFSN